MDQDFWIVAGIALAAGLASPIGGLVATRLKASTLWMSIATGLAGGILLGTLSLEMIPTALEDLPLWNVVLAIVLGVAATYGLDLFVNRGKVVGDHAEEKRRVDRFHRLHRPWGNKVMVLGLASASEELIEGLSIGVGSAISTSTALAVGLAIFVDNIAEALSIGAMAQEDGDRGWKRSTLLWSSLIGLALIASALLGYFFLRDLPSGVLAFLLAVGAGAMLYLSITQLVPEAEENQFQQSAGLAATVGFLIALVFSQL